jgi:hypothetical protein
VPQTVRRATILAACLAVIGGLAALPTAPAGASSPVKPASFGLPVGVSGLSSVEVETVLSGIPLSDLNATQLGGVLAALPGLSGFPEAKLKEGIAEAIASLSAKGDTVGQLVAGTGLLATLETDLVKLLSVPELLALLKGETLSAVLTKALSATSSSTLLGELVGKSSEPEKLIAQLLGDANPAALEGLLGSKLAAAPFVSTTVGGLATEVGVTAQKLAEDLGTTTVELPPTALALTAELLSGKTIGVLDGLGGLTLTLLTPTKESGSGTGGSGGSGSTSGVTVLVNAGSANTPSSSHRGSKASLKFKILSHRVSGGTLTVVFQVPGAGVVTFSGWGIRTRRASAVKAGRLTVHTALTRLAAAAVRRHHSHRKVTLRASFRSTAGRTAIARSAVAL